MHDLAHLIHANLSGEAAQATTAEICQFYRSPGSSGYHAATDLVAARLKATGLDDVHSSTYPLDGETVLLNRTMPLAWEPYAAEVRVVSPTPEPIVDFSTIPSCLAWWSRPTPDGGSTAELVDVGTGESDSDFAGRNLKGKIALIGGTDRPGAWTYAAAQAMQRGARGLLTDYLFYATPPFRTRKSLPEAVQLLRLPNQSGEFDAWACSIAYPEAQRLRELLRLGPVTLHADIRCCLFKGEARNLLASIPGREIPQESVFFVAHASAGTRPGANCAAGPALAVEIARTLSTLIRTGRIRPPRRSIKFLILAEGLGSHAYIATHRDELPRIKTAFCLDSVGHHQGKLESNLLFYRHPDSSPSFINDYFAGVIERAPKDGSWVFKNDSDISPVHFIQAPYTVWSDNHVWTAFGVPSPLIMSWPDKYFHTQLLTPEHTDPRVFHIAGVTTALAAYEIADAGVHDALAIADEVAARSRFRLDDVSSRAVQRILQTRRCAGDRSDAEAVARRAHRELAYCTDRDSKAIASSFTLIPGETPDAARVWLASQDRVSAQQLERAKRRVDEALAAVDGGKVD